MNSEFNLWSIKTEIYLDFRLLDKAVNQKYEEAVRVLKLSGKWFPAIQNGRCVTAYYRLSFEF